MEKLIVRARNYPKKGSLEWELSDDFLEIRVTNREKKNKTIKRTDISSIEFEKVSTFYKLFVIAGRGWRNGHIIFFNDEWVANAQKIHHQISTAINDPANMSEVRRRRIEKGNEAIRRNEEAIRRADERTKKNDQISSMLDDLEKHIDRNAFTQQEMQKLTALKNAGIDIQNRLAQLTKNATELQRESNSLTNRGTRLIERGKDEAEISKSDEAIYAKNEEVFAVNKQIYAIDDEISAHIEELKKWLELGKSRETDYGLKNM